MNLLQIRTEVVKKTGRFDLVVDTTNYVDNGANFYIQAAQRYLDRKSDLSKTLARTFKQVTAGGHFVTFRNCRVIKEVWAATSDSRFQLKKVDREKLRGVDYASQQEGYVNMFSSITQGAPEFYAPAVIRMSPDVTRSTLEDLDPLNGIGGYLDIMLTSSYSYNGIVFLPPVDETYMIEILGHFLSEELTSDTHESFWSVEHPEILVMATCREIEIFNRNSEGIKDWSLAINEKLMDIEFDDIDQETTDFDIMEG